MSPWAHTITTCENERWAWQGKKLNFLQKNNNEKSNAKHKHSSKSLCL